jgi:hypothetical protein
MVRLVLAAAFSLAASVASAASIPAAEKAAAHALAEPAPVRFRAMASHGDVVCGELAGRGERFAPLYDWRRRGGWEVHAATDSRGLRGGEVCLDREPDGSASPPACAPHDFQFYFGWDHFCR